MRLINRKMQTRKMNRKCDEYNKGMISILSYLLFFIVFANVVLYMM